MSAPRTRGGGRTGVGGYQYRTPSAKFLALASCSRAVSGLCSPRRVLGDASGRDSGVVGLDCHYRSVLLDPGATGWNRLGGDLNQRAQQEQRWHAQRHPDLPGDRPTMTPPGMDCPSAEARPWPRRVADLCDARGCLGSRSGLHNKPTAWMAWFGKPYRAYQPWVRPVPDVLDLAAPNGRLQPALS